MLSSLLLLAVALGEEPTAFRVVDSLTGTTVRPLSVVVDCPEAPPLEMHALFPDTAYPLSALTAVDDWEQCGLLIVGRRHQPISVQLGDLYRWGRERALEVDDGVVEVPAPYLTQHPTTEHVVRPHPTIGFWATTGNRCAVEVLALSEGEVGHEVFYGVTSKRCRGSLSRRVRPRRRRRSGFLSVPATREMWDVSSAAVRLDGVTTDPVPDQPFCQLGRPPTRAGVFVVDEGGEVVRSFGDRYGLRFQHVAVQGLQLFADVGLEGESQLLHELVEQLPTRYPVEAVYPSSTMAFDGTFWGRYASSQHPDAAYYLAPVDQGFVFILGEVALFRCGLDSETSFACTPVARRPRDECSGTLVVTGKIGADSVIEFEAVESAPACPEVAHVLRDRLVPAPYLSPEAQTTATDR